jgi:hypothetical protein
MSNRKFQVSDDVVYVSPNNDLIEPVEVKKVTRKKVTKNTDTGEVFDKNGEQIVAKPKRPRTAAQIAATQKLIESNKKRAADRRAKLEEAQIQVTQTKVKEAEKKLEKKNQLIEKVKSGELVAVPVKKNRHYKKQVEIISDTDSEDDDSLIKDLKEIADTEPISDTEFDTELPTEVEERSLPVRKTIPKPIKQAIQKIKKVKEEIKAYDPNRVTQSQIMKQIPSMANNAVSTISALINSRWR